MRKVRAAAQITAAANTNIPISLPAAATRDSAGHGLRRSMIMGVKGGMNDIYLTSAGR